MTALTVLVVARGAAPRAAAMQAAVAAAAGLPVPVRAATRHTLVAACRAVDTPWTLVLHDSVTALPELCRAHGDAHAGGAALVAGSAMARGPGMSLAGPAAMPGGSVSAPAAVLAQVVAGACADPESLDLLLRLEERLGPAVVLSRPTVTPVPGDALTEAAARGRARARDARRHPGRAAALRAGFRDSSPREVALRRALVAARIPARLVAAAPGLRRVAPAVAYWSALRRGTARRDWPRVAGGVPVLMFHAFAAPGEATGRYVVGPRRLAVQLVALRLMGMRPISLTELIAGLARGQEPPPRRFAVTIDDGYRDTLTVAAPVLRRLRVPATLFVVSDHLGGANRWDPDGPLTGRPLIAAADVAHLAARGVTLGAHTRTHPRLADLDDAAAAAQIAGSVAAVRALMDAEAVVPFAYPHGSLNAATPGLVAAAGGVGAVTTEPGLVTAGADVFRLPRVEMRGTDSWWRFVMKVRTGHDRWV